MYVCCVERVLIPKETGRCWLALALIFQTSLSDYAALLNLSQLPKEVGRLTVYT